MDRPRKLSCRVHGEYHLPRIFASSPPLPEWGQASNSTVSRNSSPAIPHLLPWEAWNDDTELQQCLLCTSSPNADADTMSDVDFNRQIIADNLSREPNC